MSKWYNSLNPEMRNYYASRNTGNVPRVPNAPVVRNVGGSVINQYRMERLFSKNLLQRQKNAKNKMLQFIKTMNVIPGSNNLITKYIAEVNRSNRPNALVNEFKQAYTNLFFRKQFGNMPIAAAKKKRMNNSGLEGVGPLFAMANANAAAKQKANANAAAARKKYMENVERKRANAIKMANEYTPDSDK